MNKDGLKIILVFAVISLFMGYALLDKGDYQGSIPDPVQTNLVPPQNIMITGDKGEVDLTLLAQYSIEAVIKSKTSYSDYPSQISKYDFALAWGDLSKEEIDKDISYSQRGRWYYYRYSQEGKTTGEYIAQHSANVHLIHKDEGVLSLIKKADEGEHIRMQGYLVSANFKDGPWKSSLSRTDTGNGACEIMYVTGIQLLD